MAFPSSPIEKQIDPTDGSQSNCSPPTTSGDTIRLGNSGNVYGVQHGWVFSKNGPYEYNGKLYAAFVDTLANTIEVWASADGVTWAELDAASHPSCKANDGDSEIGSGGAFPDFGSETIAVAARLIPPDPVGDWYAALYVAYVRADDVWGLGTFNLDTEEWEAGLASGINPMVGSGATMRPNPCLEYRAVNDDLVLFWQSFDGGDDETVYLSIITATFGSATVFTGGSGTARILYGSCVVPDSGRIYVETVSAVLSKVYVRTLGSDNSYGTEQQVGEEVTSGVFQSRAWGGQLCARADGTVCATWFRRRQLTSISSLDFQIHAALSDADAAAPSWTDTTVHDWSGPSSEFYPIAVETSDGELYCIWQGKNISSPERILKYSLWDDDSETWLTEGALVDLSLPIEGTDACENETNWGAYSALPVGTSFGLVFDRGTADFDPDSVADPRGARYDYSLPVWFFGDPLDAELAELNYYGPNGPMEPTIPSGGPYSL